MTDIRWPTPDEVEAYEAKIRAAGPYEVLREVWVVDSLKDGLVWESHFTGERRWVDEGQVEFPKGLPAKVGDEHYVSNSTKWLKDNDFPPIMRKKGKS